MCAGGYIKCCFVAISMLVASLCMGQVKAKMEHYSTEDGLSHNNVTSIIKSSDGYHYVHAAKYSTLPGSFERNL